MPSVASRNLSRKEPEKCSAAGRLEEVRHRRLPTAGGAVVGE